MKKRLFCALAVCFSVALFAAPEYQEGNYGPDGKLFLDPHLTSLAEKTALVSVNIGCNTPSTAHVLSNNVCEVVGLGAHFQQFSEQLKDSGKGVIAVPASYGVIFTDGSISDESAIKSIQDVLAKIGDSTDSKLIADSLGELKEIYRATFAMRDNKLVLVTDEKQLHSGEIVWRKTPSGAETNIFHSEEEYLVALRNAGLVVEEVKRPCFYGELKYKMHRSALKEGEKGLGAAYISNNPFTLFYVTKKA